ncbi:hypothetical protein GMRT_10912 [Giardia muris]|uniref:Uncharacterized protein n=1 Tax=Giardia muris TaxID=5742 RepID=A0A4Z1TB44_GIAMU|nr:hypothetical protein GMRT_10912 [Giardia muris]|eukprot:TNJ30467.1 hypothetical protein GMRT_10912 [Giardia muris]
MCDPSDPNDSNDSSGSSSSSSFVILPEVDDGLEVQTASSIKARSTDLTLIPPSHSLLDTSSKMIPLTFLVTGPYQSGKTRFCKTIWTTRYDLTDIDRYNSFLRETLFIDARMVLIHDEIGQEIQLTLIDLPGHSQTRASLHTLSRLPMITLCDTISGITLYHEYLRTLGTPQLFVLSKVDVCTCTILRAAQLSSQGLVHVTEQVEQRFLSVLRELATCFGIESSQVMLLGEDGSHISFILNLGIISFLHPTNTLTKAISMIISKTCEFELTHLIPLTFNSKKVCTFKPISFPRASTTSPLRGLTALYAIPRTSDCNDILLFCHTSQDLPNSHILQHFSGTELLLRLGTGEYCTPPRVLSNSVFAVSIPREVYQRSLSFTVHHSYVMHTSLKVVKQPTAIPLLCIFASFIPGVTLIQDVANDHVALIHTAGEHALNNFLAAAYTFLRGIELDALLILPLLPQISLSPIESSTRVTVAKMLQDDKNLDLSARYTLEICLTPWTKKLKTGYQVGPLMNDFSPDSSIFDQCTTLLTIKSICVTDGTVTLIDNVLRSSLYDNNHIPSLIQTFSQVLNSFGGIDFQDVRIVVTSFQSSVEAPPTYELPLFALEHAFEDIKVQTYEPMYLVEIEVSTFLVPIPHLRERLKTFMNKRHGTVLQPFSQLATNLPVWRAIVRLPVLDAIGFEAELEFTLPNACTQFYDDGNEVTNDGDVLRKAINARRADARTKTRIHLQWG